MKYSHQVIITTPLISISLKVSTYDTLNSVHMLVLGGINILLPVYGIANSKRSSVFHGILIKHN